MEILRNFALLVFTIRECSFAQQPDLYWSMDKGVGSVIYPDNTNDTKWKGDMSQLPSGKEFVPGYIDNAIYVQYEVKLSQDLYTDDCLYDLKSCENGLSIGFWIKLLEWDTSRDFNGLLFTSNYGSNIAGLYIGDNEHENQIKFFIYETTGRQYLAKIQLPPIDVWTHIGFTWDRSQIQVFINGSVLTRSQYTVPPQSTTVSDTVLIKKKLGTGSVYAEYYLDDLKVFYRTISNGDMAKMAAGTEKQTEPLTTTEHHKTSTATTQHTSRPDTTTKTTQSTTKRSLETTRHATKLYTTTTRPVDITKPSTTPTTKQATCPPCKCVSSALPATDELTNLETTSLIILGVIVFVLLILIVAMVCIRHRHQRRLAATGGQRGVYYPANRNDDEFQLYRQSDKNGSERKWSVDE